MLRRRDFLTLLLPAICAVRLQAQLTGPGRGNDWEVGHPKDAGFQPTALEKLTAALKGGTFPNTHAVLIEHDGRLVYEQYFAGTDERWLQPLGKRVFDVDSLHDLRSASKSVTSAVLGIALDTNFDKALVRPIGSFFPHLKLRPELDAVTLHHVLTMTAGLECNEMTVPYTDPKNDELQMYTVRDFTEGLGESSVVGIEREREADVLRRLRMDQVERLTIPVLEFLENPTGDLTATIRERDSIKLVLHGCDRLCGCDHGCFAIHYERGFRGHTKILLRC